MLFLRMALLSDGRKKAAYLKKIQYFEMQGENVYWQPVKLPPEPELLKLGNNVVIASEVLFVTHDAIHYMTNHLSESKHQYQLYLGAIEIGDNVFIGSRTMIMPNVKITDNVIVGAGSIITHDLKESGVYVGSPARKIGDFNQFLEKRCLDKPDLRKKEKRYKQVWDNFYEERNM
ncbi:DapH/DapD/GlmU-related protein [Sellimonas catena]|uniref:Acyltransferase n=1 Tax=Sellimonas catena TaxID=2994035 RepID=A0A9W6FH67_9FIRM|nr:acyltransferase [Sellimonas catena]GLG91671.1 hypothetical protein Selli2_30980 [Sellimonas catena]